MNQELKENVGDGFELHEQQIRHKNARGTAIIAAVISLSGTVLDWVVYPQHLVAILGIRVAAAMLSMLIYWLLGRSRSQRSVNSLSAALPIVIIVSILLMVGITEGGDSPYYAGLNLVLVALAILMRWTWKTSLVMCCFVLFAYLLAVIPSFATGHFAIIFNNIFFIAANAALVIFGTHFYEKTRRNEFSLKQEVEEQNRVLAENQLQLQELDEAKTRFFANVSHELRTPLTIMLGTTETLREHPADNPEDRLKVLHSNGLRLLALIDNLLDLVRSDQGDDSVNRRPIEVESFLRGLVSGVMHLGDRKEILVVFENETPLPVLSLDEDKLEKVVLNLLINAIKFTNFGGKISLFSSYHDGSLRFRVVDNGMGMSPEKQEQIFNRFWQADTSSNRKFRGSGIGLSLVKSLVDVMDGEISVTSEEGKGSSFHVSFPASVSTQLIADTAIKDDPIAAMHRQAMLSAPVVNHPEEVAVSAAPSGKEFRILVADDEDDLRNFLSTELARNHEIIEARDGVEAFELTKQYEPDLVLLDYMMPDKNGMEVCREIRASRRLSHIPIIMLTARADEKIKFECLASGASDFVSKPFALGELNLRVQNQIRMIAFQRDLREKNQALETAMDELKENEVKMLRHEKLSSLGRMSAGIIHEINNPLNYVQAAHHMLGMHGSELAGETHDYFADALKDATEGVERVVNIVKDLRSFTTADSQVFGLVNLYGVIDQAQKLISDQFGEKITTTIEVPPELTVHGNQGQLVQIFVNFFQNAVHAINDRQTKEPDHAGFILIEAGQIPNSDDSPCVICTFRDNGCGISPENREKIFDPFFTSKEVGEGMGLGLSIVHQIIERHKAEVSIQSQEGEFTEFHLSFPVASQSTSPNSKTHP